MMNKRVRHKRSKRGFTLLEILVVVAIGAFVAAGISVGVTQAISDSKGRQCAANLATGRRCGCWQRCSPTRSACSAPTTRTRSGPAATSLLGPATIEGAKDEFSRDNPGVALTSLDQLAPYLRYGVPTCPAGGTYANVLNSGQSCTCSLGTAGKPGFHSLAQP